MRKPGSTRAVGSSSDAPGAAPRFWLMPASTATTGTRWAAGRRVNGADRAVPPLPPLPANAIFM